MDTTLANSVFANGVAVLRTMTEDLSPAVENKHIIFMKKMQESKETVPKLWYYLRRQETLGSNMQWACMFVAYNYIHNIVHEISSNSKFISSATKNLMHEIETLWLALNSFILIWGV